MTRNGEQQDISAMPFNSQQAMVIQAGGEDNSGLIQIPIDTEIQYYDSETNVWIEATVLSFNTVKVSETIVNLPANTQIKVKESEQQQGVLVLSTKMYNIEYNAEDLQAAYQYLYGSGIIKEKLFGAIYSGGGRQIIIDSAMFVIDGIFGFFKNRQSVMLDVGDSQPRIDLIVLRKSQTDQDVFLAVKKGTPSATPSAVPLTENPDGIYEIPIAEITMQANATVVSGGDIKDVRRAAFRFFYSYPTIKETSFVAGNKAKGNLNVGQVYNNAGMVQGFESVIDIRNSILQLNQTEYKYLKEEDIEIVDWNLEHSAESYARFSPIALTIGDTQQNIQFFHSKNSVLSAFMRGNASKMLVVIMVVGDRNYTFNLHELNTSRPADFLTQIDISQQYSYKIAGNDYIWNPDINLRRNIMTICCARAGGQASAGYFGIASAKGNVENENSLIPVKMTEALFMPQERVFHQPYIFSNIYAFYIIEMENMNWDLRKIEIPTGIYCDCDLQRIYTVRYRIR